MNTQINGHLTIKDYASRHGVSESTVRRKIKSGALMAERVNGKWYIEEEQANSQMDSQAEQVNSQSEQAESSQAALIDHLTTEVEYLRSQLDKQTTLLAATTKHNDDLVKQLPPPRVSVFNRLKKWVRERNG